MLRGAGGEGYGSHRHRGNPSCTQVLKKNSKKHQGQDRNDQSFPSNNSEAKLGTPHFQSEASIQPQPQPALEKPTLPAPVASNLSKHSTCKVRQNPSAISSNKSTHCVNTAPTSTKAPPTRSMIVNAGAATPWVRHYVSPQRGCLRWRIR